MLTCNQILQNFKRVERPNGDVVYAYPNDDDFKDLIFELHEGRFPNDILQDLIHSAVCALHDSDRDLDDALESLNVFASNAELCDWLLQFHDKFEELRDEYGIDSTGNIFSLLMSGYGYHAEQVLYAVAEWFDSQDELAEGCNAETE